MTMLHRLVMMMPKVTIPVFATWNSSDKSANITLSGSNLIATNTGAGIVRSTIGKTTGKWYWEVTLNNITNSCLGVSDSATNLNIQLGQTNQSYGYYPASGDIITNGGVLITVATSAINDKISFALNFTTGTIDIRKNNTLLHTLSGLTITGAIFAATGGSGSPAQSTANFGATALTYTPPAGYNAGLYV